MGVKLMARPKARDLTERKQEVKHAFWNHGPQTVAEVRDRLAAEGRDLAYTTVATLVLIRGQQPISKQWSAAYLTVLVIDHKGILRKRWDEAPNPARLNDLVAELVENAESDYSGRGDQP